MSEMKQNKVLTENAKEHVVEKVSLRSALKSSPSSVVDIVLGTLILNILALALPLTLMQVYDRIIAQHATETLFVLSSSCALAVVFETIVHVSRDRIASWCGSRFEFNGIMKGFEMLLHSPIFRLEQERTIERLEQMESFSALKSTYFLRAIQNFIDIPFAFINLFLVYYLLPRVGLYLSCLVVIILVFHFILFVLSYFYQKKEHSTHRNRDKKIIETFRLINMIRSLSMEEAILRRIEKVQEKFANLHLKSIGFASLSSSFLQAVPQVAIFIVLLVGSEGVLSHKISIGVLTTAMMLAGRCVSPVISLVSGWLHFEEKNIQERNVNELLSMEEDPWTNEEMGPKLNGSIRLENISFTYNPESEAILKKISVNIIEKTLCYVQTDFDRSASVFIDILNRNLEATAGQIYFDDKPLKDIFVNEFYRDVHAIYKTPTFFRGTVLENLASFDVARFDDAIRVSKELGLEDVIAKFELGYSSIFDRENLLSISQNLLMQMAIARAVVKSPSILLTNGIESGMDVDTKKLFIKVLRLLKGKCTIICVSNDPVTASISDRILYLREGIMIDDREEAFNAT